MRKAFQSFHPNSTIAMVMKKFHENHKFNISQKASSDISGKFFKIIQIDFFNFSISSTTSNSFKLINLLLCLHVD
jgi:hypothetical protein